MDDKPTQIQEPVYEYVEKDRIKLIEIKIKKINQLFNSFDPSPFLEKDLDDDAFDYIVQSVEEHPLRARQKIVIHLPKREMRRISEHEIRSAIHHHFSYRKKLAERNVRHKVQEGEWRFIIGISFLTTCLFLSNYIAKNYDTLGSNILQEGLYISGWVAMWTPIQTVLYDWWPIKKKEKVYDKISKMDIEFREY